MRTVTGASAAPKDADAKIKAATEGGIRTVIVRAPKLVNVVPA